MINLLLKKLEKISMTKGRFFSDKSYKYDTIFFITRYLYEYISDDKLTIDSSAQEKIIEKLVKAFNLPANQTDSNKNYLLETLGFLCYTGALQKESATEYKICDISQLDFITVSIENAYIYQYLVAYKTFVNDNLWNLYLQYLSTKVKSEKEELLQKIKELMCHLSPSIGDPNSVWASNMVKFPIMVLGLANSDNVVSRTLNVKDEIIEPKDLSANVEGTRSSSVKDNFYLHDFRINYVKDYLSGTKTNLIINKLVVDESKRIKGGRNIILYGVPGAGKSYTIETEYCKDEEKMERLVFHPDYTYSDFVGQILPSIDESSESKSIQYKFEPGPFTTLLKKAYRDPDNKYYLIIEEINRGNAPAIFGDVFQLLDRKPDGTSMYGITNTDIAKIVYDDHNHKVRIPSNMSILCTMNTSDQNVFTLDTAFQRRWNMRLIENTFKENDEIANIKILDSSVTWRVFQETINEIILNTNVRLTSAEDKRLGTHFVVEEDLKYNDKADTGTGQEQIDAKLENRRFAEKVIKYLWDDAFKFNRESLFNVRDNGTNNSLEAIIRSFLGAKGDDRFNIFLDNIKRTMIDESKPKDEATGDADGTSETN